jgi:AcrR family transcriptional regulator
MPKKTFYNLPDGKQNQIIDSAIEEFSRGTYKEIPISAIIKRAGIPRTSFYDYFEDKMDLYSYIIDMIGRKKAKYMTLRSDEEGFFDELRNYLISGATFIAKEPKLNTIASNFLSDKKLIEEIYGVDSMDVQDIFYEMLTKGIARGELRANINKEFMTRTLNVLSSGLMLKGLEKNGNIEAVILEMADEMILFIKEGLAI